MEWRRGNSLKKDLSTWEAPLEAALLLTSSRTKVVWTERLDIFICRTLSTLSPGAENEKCLIYFMAGLQGGGFKEEPNDEKKKKTDLYEPLTMDKISESCLILMVLLLLTCARHLIVDCTASTSTHSSLTPFQHRPPGGALSAKLFPSSVTSSELSSKCHRVCYKSCNPSLCLQIVAFLCWNTWWKLVVFSPPKNKTKEETQQWSLDASWLSLSSSASPASIHPFIRWASIHQRRYRTGIINLDYLKKRWLMRRAVALTRRCFSSCFKHPLQVQVAHKVQM